MATTESIEKILNKYFPKPTLPTIEVSARISERIESFWLKAIQAGWYPNNESKIALPAHILQDQSEFDEYMIRSIDYSWKKLTNSMLSVYPERAHILRCAFDLHKSENYIASIPLFFTQADGIVAQNLRAHFFTDHDARNGAVNSKIAELDAITSAFLKLLQQRTQFQEGISKSSKKLKALAPNRNGILHGSRKHLDYGSRVNSYKSFSLLSYIQLISTIDNNQI